MNTAKLKTFAQDARRHLLDQVAARVEAALRMEGAAAAENARAIDELKKAIFETSKAAVIERAAYTWFNRFCALRFMDVNGYSLVRAVSPVEGATQPEVLAEAKQGIIHEDLLAPATRKRVNDLLTGNLRSTDAQGEAYRLLLVGVCNYYHRAMPYLFEKIEDYTELLLPVDLLSDDSVLSATCRALDEEACENVEVIGWLYQFYISEKKDAVFASKAKVAAEDIPAATQLFTPNWIVRYLVENSLGRLWMLNHPDSRLVERMDYYIAPEQPETDFLKIQSPEDLRICDPACGSGHMLVYAFDLLYAIYEEMGYAPSDVPTLILTKNLYGIEIDERAGALAAFALTMKAREKQRRFFRNPVAPQVCVLENVEVNEDELTGYMAAIGRNLFTFNLATLLHQFKDAKNFGSLIRPAVTDVRDLLATPREKNLGGQMFTYQTHQKVLKALAMADYLSPKYHVVVANPPYMGGRNLNDDLRSFAQSEYKDTKSDLFAMFIERNLELTLRFGYVAMITMQNWMFLSSFEEMREKLLSQYTILSMAHLGIGAFDTLNSKVVQTTAFVLQHAHLDEHKGAYLRLTDGFNEIWKQQFFPEAAAHPYRASAADFRKIPGSPIAYWVSDRVREIFAEATSLGEIAEPRQGLATGDNDRFLRLWYEVSNIDTGFEMSSISAAHSSGKIWFPYNKGGQYRKWYGNNDYLIRFDKPSYDFLATVGNHLPSRQFYFQEGITWSALTSGSFSIRYSPKGFVFDTKGPVIFFDEESISVKYLLGCLNSKPTYEYLKILAPTLDFNQGPLRKLPLVNYQNTETFDFIGKSVELAKADWDAYETSWGFVDLPLLRAEFHADTLANTYAAVCGHWQFMTDEMQRLEEENNRIFINAYGLQDELTSDVPLEEITLTCNPRYRYAGKRSDDELEALLLADTMREFISYAVGCMFGRYALEQPGLILANQGETLEDYLRRIPQPSFPADRDNVIPILDGEWFSDDIVERFRQFLRLTFGAEHFDANLDFIEAALGRDIRAYFTRDFYSDHVRRYQKRPIYWLFSSPSGAFNALVYMHRYRPDTVSVVLNDYLREYHNKLSARISYLEVQSTSASASKQDKTAALKEIERLRKIVRELNDYEHDVLYPLATRQVKIDLDDGVKVNYKKFGRALKPIAGFDSE